MYFFAYYLFVNDGLSLLLLFLFVALKMSIQSTPKESCYKDDWHSIVNFIEQYVNMTLKSTLNIYDADKTGKVDYALESAGKYKIS